MAPVGLRVIDPDYINIMITGHQHTIFVDLQERLTSEAAIAKAKAAGAKGFKLVGCTCVGQDLQLRGAHYEDCLLYTSRNFGVQGLDELPEIDPVQMEDFKAEAEEEIQLQLNI